MEKRRNFKPEEKARIVLEILKEERTITDIAAAYEVHPNQISRWKAEFLQNAGRVFNKDKEEEDIQRIKQSYEKEKDELHRQIGQLKVEVDWLKKKYNQINSPGRQGRHSGFQQ